MSLIVSNGDLNIDTGLDVDVGDLTHHLSRGVQVQDPLVDAHLEAVIGVSTFTARRLPGHNAENLGGHADRARSLQVSLNGLGLEVGAH